MGRSRTRCAPPNITLTTSVITLRRLKNGCQISRYNIHMYAVLMGFKMFQGETHELGRDYICNAILPTPMCRCKTHEVVKHGIHEVPVLLRVLITTSLHRFYHCVDWSGDGSAFTAFEQDCAPGTMFDVNMNDGAGGCNFPNAIVPPPACLEGSGDVEGSGETGGTVVEGSGETGGTVVEGSGETGGTVVEGSGETGGTVVEGSGEVDGSGDSGDGDFTCTEGGLVPHKNCKK